MSSTSAGPMANSVFVVGPHHGYPVAPGGMPQVPLYPRSQPQVHLIPGNPPGLERSVCVQPAQRVLKDGKTLGAIQILIGLIHIGLGSVMGTLLHGYYYVAVSFYGGFPFWGGIWFIISGCLSVSAENQPRSTCLLNGSLGLNIVSAICSVVGIVLFITDMSITNQSVYPNYYPYWEVSHTESQTLDSWSSTQDLPIPSGCRPLEWLFLACCSSSASWSSALHAHLPTLAANWPAIHPTVWTWSTQMSMWQTPWSSQNRQTRHHRCIPVRSRAPDKQS
ncbi:membrane-spanning 4-domains subfamily A member 8 isoform X1 [Rhinolophus sinicus]|uniref:membrane-spanning 4-domains subfamily A member 8 isoform X1 n=1 Tax=Rhinolophus sinicus TaxID=89399 RepID=UPI003D7AAE73